MVDRQGLTTEVRSAGTGLATLAFLLAALVFLTTPATLIAQELRHFTPRFSTNDHGGILLVGNTVMTCPDANVDCAAARQRLPGAPINNNSYAMIFVDVDSDASTLNSSESTLTIPAGATNVSWAGLYWFGRNDQTASPALQRNQVLFSGPTSPAYEAIQAAVVDTLEPGSYESFADVTAIVAAQGSGVYRTANIRSGAGIVDSTGGWALVVVYQDPTAAFRNLTVFDGAALVTTANPTVTATVQGILTPLTGSVTGEIGAVAWEGDTGTSVFVRDGFRVNGVLQSNALNPQNDFFNSTISVLGAAYTTRTPADLNTFGVDIDRIQAAGLTNGLTQLALQFTTTGDRYAAQVITSAVDIHLPSLQTFAKTVQDLDGGAVLAGDVLRYTLTATNTGADGAGHVVITDPIPALTTYVPGSLQIVASPGGIAGAKTDAAGDDQADFDSVGNRVIFRVGTGANGSAGGLLAEGESFTLRFDVSVNTPVPSSASIINTTDVTYDAATTGTGFAGHDRAEAVINTPPDAPNLTPTQTDNGQLFSRGASGTYTITVRNLGALDTNLPVTIVMTPSTGLTATGLTGVGWTCDVPTLTCTRPDVLAAGASYPDILLTVAVASDAPPTVSNTATVSGGGELFAGDDVVVEQTPVQSTADLGLTKIANPATTYTPGQALSYTLTIANNGPTAVPANGYTVVDALPAGIASEPWTCATTPVVTCTVVAGNLQLPGVPALAQGEQFVVTLSTLVPAALTTPLDNTATVTLASEGISDGNADNNSASTHNAFVAVPPAQVSGHVRDEDGVPIADIGVTLSGGSSATAITDEDGAFSFPDLPPGVDYTVTPTSSLFTFVPPSRTFAGLGDAATADFIGVPATTPTPSVRYFAEGATGLFFHTTFNVFNFSADTATVSFRFQRSDGQEITHEISVPTLQGTQLDASTVSGLDAAVFSAIVRSEQRIAVSRTMSWDARDYGTHISQGVDGPRPTWYFAEGASGIFDMFYLIQNPGDQEATIDATFFRPEPLAPVTRTLTVPAHSRGTFKANDDGELKSGEMGARFAARDALPIIVDRSMYPSLHGLLYEAGSTSVGSPSLDTHWTFAEGATGSFFDTFLLLMNPGESPASVTVHFTFEGGGTLDKSYTVAAQSRRSIFVDVEDPLLKSAVFALDVDSTNEVPIVAERTVYWPGGSWYGSKSGLGANAPAVSWLLSDATVDAETTTYLLVKGTSETSTSVEVQLLFADGSPSASSVVTVPPQGRATLNLRELFPDASGKRFALLVQSSGESPAPIVVEFASYRTVDGVTWSAGDGGLLVPLR